MPYMLIFVQALWTKGWQGESCVICTAGERLVSPHGSTDKGRSCFPWQLSWANRCLEGRCFEHPLYKDPTPPGVALESLEKEATACGTLDWTGQIPIMMWRCWMKRVSAWAYGALPTATKA